MILGLFLESFADYTKNNFKKANPKRFCDVGVFKLVRCPNYLGEVLIWTGVFVSGVTVFSGVWQWVAAIFGWVCIEPGDGTGMYETIQSFKEQGMIKHIGITAHKIGIAEECVKSGLYETMQFPFSYLSSQREIDLVNLCKEKNVGFIAMKGLAGGFITNAKAAYTFMTQYDNVLPIWGVQRMNELEEWLSFMELKMVML
ncbi:MAG: aldo/keto reductase [Treponema sp.]|nr:aldo/keto reductase [Treponema sp.]